MVGSPIRPTRLNRRCGVTLVELLVVVGVIGVLVSLLLPAVQSAREAARGAQCKNRLRQLGLATHNYLAATGHLPPATTAKPTADDPTAPWTFFRWSAWATLAPYLENRAAQDAIDLDAPLYVGQQINPVQRGAVRLLLPELLCPSDLERRVTDSFGPANYAICTGPGDDGRPHDTEGVSHENSRVRPAQVTDGLSHTALASESLLGVPAPDINGPHDPQREYRFITSHLVGAARCGASRQWNYRDPRGFSWVNGEYRTTMYNHRYPPNSDEVDCLGVFILGPPETRFRPYGWRAARSAHPRGVNVLLADGSVRRVSDDIDLTLWRMLSTIAGGETEAAE